MKQRSTEQALRGMIIKEQEEVTKLRAKAEILEKAKEDGVAKLFQLESMNANMKMQVRGQVLTVAKTPLIYNLVILDVS